jgi:serine/threonine protein kinase
MPAPTTLDDLIDLTHKSGLVDSSRLTAYVQSLREQASMPAERQQLADRMVGDGLLTRFQADQLLLGKWKRFSIGKYKVLERLGAGGMGQVFLCEHKLMRRRVAVKVLPTAKLAEDDSSCQRFFREARAIAALDHPNIVRAHDIDQDGSLYFLVMEYIDGPSLQDIVRKSGPMDPDRAAHYVSQAANGLQYAFQVAGLVHRDIKPCNILVDRAGVVKLLDMGLARFFHEDDDNLTKRYEDNILGTADYLSPEQARDSHGVDVRADIYSLGATFYFLLTGHPPFPQGNVAQKLVWHQTRQPKPVRLQRPEVPESMAAVLERMMMKDEAARYQTPAEVAEALAPFVQTPIPPPSDEEMPRLSPAAAALGVPGAPSAASGRFAPSHHGMAGQRAVGPAAVLPAAAPRGAGHTVGPQAVAREAAGTHSVGQALTLPAPPTAASRHASRPSPASRQDPSNPFTPLMGPGASSAGVIRQAPAVPAARRPGGPHTPASGLARLAAALIGLAAVAGGGFMLWRYVLDPQLKEVPSAAPRPSAQRLTVSQDLPGVEVPVAKPIGEDTPATGQATALTSSRTNRL